MEVRIYGEGRYYAERVEESDLQDHLEIHFVSGEKTEASYFRPLVPFDIREIAKYNGNHFIFGWVECFMQSDQVPPWMIYDALKVEVRFHYGN